MRNRSRPPAAIRAVADGAGTSVAALEGADAERARVRLPPHVVFRAFVAETVVLNLNAGRYHGLNPTAGRMLELLDAHDSIAEAADAMASEAEQPRERVLADVLALCRDLAVRGLVEVERGG